VQYFRAHFLQVHRRNNENRRVLYTHFTSVVVRPCSLKNALSLVEFLLIYRIPKQLNVSLGMVSLFFCYSDYLLMAKHYSARFYLQRLSPIGGTSIICAMCLAVPLFYRISLLVIICVCFLNVTPFNMLSPFLTSQTSCLFFTF
jgi:hypothetical protein